MKTLDPSSRAALDLASGLDSLLALIPAGDPWVLDVPQPNTDGLALIARRATTQVFATARMYTGPAPAIALDRVLGVTTFELG